MQRTKMALQNTRMLSILRLGVMFYCLYFYDPYENVVRGNFSLSNACVVKKRDINIGVMLPMTIPHLEPGCTRLSLESARFAEFIAYSVERVNKERPLAFNLTMGYIILDNCFRGYVTSGHAVSFLHQPACSGDHSDTDLMENYDVVAVMSADSNVFSRSSCRILDSGQVPYISILSNDDHLLYPYFTTIMPSNRFLFEVITTILEKYSWTYVVIFVTRNHFEIQDMYTFTDLLEDNGICYHMQWIDNPISRVNLATVVKKFRRVRRSGRVVVLLTQDEYIVRDVIFELSLYTSAGKMIWIITIPVSHIDKESLEHLMGSLIVDVKDFNVPEFDEWLVQLDNKLHDPWYRSYWEKKFDCSFDRATCNTSQILDKNDFRQDMVFNYGGYVIDSVFMIASAVSRVLLSTDCNNVDGSSARGCVTGPRLLKELKATSQKGYTGWVTLHNDRESYDRHITIRQLALLVVPMAYGIRWHKLTMLYLDKPEVILMCSWPGLSVTAFLTSNIPLMCGSALLAFKTRHLPNNFNESHFICICVCTTIIVFVSFIPTLVSTTYELTKTKILAIILLINHSVALTFLFLPKVYAVQKWKDVQLTTALTNKDGTSCKPLSSITCSTVMFNTKGHKPVCSDPPSAISSPTDQRQKTEETGESGKFDPQTITQKALSDTGLVQSDNNPEAVLETSVHLDDEDGRGQTEYKTEETVQSDNGPTKIIQETKAFESNQDPAKIRHETEEAVRSDKGPAKLGRETEEAVQADNGPERVRATSLPSADEHATLNKPTSQSGTVQKPESSDVKISHHDQDLGGRSNESSFNDDVQVADKHLASETAGILDSVTGMLRNPSPEHK